MYIQFDQMSPAAQAAVRAWKPVDASGAVGDVSQRSWSLSYSLVKSESVNELNPCNLQPFNWTNTKLNVSTSPKLTQPLLLIRASFYVPACPLNLRHILFQMTLVLSVDLGSRSWSMIIELMSMSNTRIINCIQASQRTMELVWYKLDYEQFCTMF